MQKEITKLQEYRKEIKIESEARISNCYCCGKEITFGRIFCDGCNIPINKQIFEFFSEFPKNRAGELIRPRGEKLYQLIKYYLAARFGISNDKKIVLKSISGAGKSLLIDMIAFIELTHFPNSLTIIGSVAEKVSQEHIIRLREWISNSIFRRYMEGTHEATASKTEIKLAKLNSRVLSMPQSEKTRTGWHPCIPGDSEVLTPTGWKKISLVKENDVILSFDKDSENLKWESVLAKLKYKHDGQMIEWYHPKRNFKMKVTPNHRIIWKHDSTQDWRVDLALNLENRKSIVIPAKANAIINNHDIEDVFKIKDKCYDTKTFLKFLGYFLSEGWTHNEKQISICQHTKSKYYQEIKKNLHELWNTDIHYHQKKWTWTKYDPVLAKWLNENCGIGSHGKYVPKFIFNLNPELIKLVLISYLQGDGHLETGARGERWSSHTVSKELADDINALEVLVGWGSSVRRNNRKQYIVTQLLGQRHFTSEAKRIPWNNFVYSIQVPSTFHVIRQDGIVFITGNSLLLVDEVARMRKEAFYGSFFQMGRTTGVIQIACSTPFLDSLVMQDMWNDDDMIKIPLEPEDCWWIPKEVFRDAKNMPPELYEQLFQAKFRSVSNRVIPDDLLLQAMQRGEHYPTSKNLVMGIDFGRSIDPTAVVVLDIETGDVKFVETFNDEWQIQFQKIRKLYKDWNPIRIVADKSSIGDVIISDLQDLPIQGVSIHNDILKKQLVDKLVMAFYNYKINIVNEEFPKLASELGNFVYYDSEHKKVGPVGRGHDDCVDSLALCLKAMDVSSIRDNPLPNNLWSFTRVDGSSSNDPWKISNI